MDYKGGLSFVETDIELTSNTFRAILKHLVYLEEMRDFIVNEFFGELLTLHDYYSVSLDKYIKKLEELIKRARVIDKAGSENLEFINNLPYVIIGCTVILENLSTHNTHFFKIISPYSDSLLQENLSCLSALGKALMLRKTGDIIKADLNGDEGLYKIKSIRYV
jgi:transcription elongation factor GreA